MNEIDELKKAVNDLENEKDDLIKENESLNERINSLQNEIKNVEKIKEIGYDDESKGLNYKTCDIIQKITMQSRDISQAVHENKKEEDMGAGDQGLMFGYATNETKELFPFSHLMALKLSLKLTEVRKNGELDYLRPDGKTQVTVEYGEDGKPKRIDTIVISTQHDENVSLDKIHHDMIKYVVKPVIPAELLDGDVKYFI